jgi:hypothetical protein
MGFGFNLFFIFIIVPFTAILLVLWIVTRKKLFGITVGIVWLGIFGFALLIGTIQWLTNTELEKEDYYGQYIVEREFFPGNQADWQYENFRFEIKDNDSIYFYITDKEKILKTFRGTIAATDPSQYSSERLIIKMDQPTHHILTSNPTTYRGAWGFNLIFYSPKFNNVCFKKGQWITLDK